MAVPLYSGGLNKEGYTMVGKLRITKFSNTEFHFEIDNMRDAPYVLALQRFEYEGRYYKVLNVVETFDVSGYKTYMAYTKPDTTLLARIKLRVKRGKNR